MPIFGVKSSFLELGILAVQKRELIIEEVHIKMKTDNFCKENRPEAKKKYRLLTEKLLYSIFDKILYRSFCVKMNGGFLVTKIKQLGDRIFEKILSEKNIDAFNGAQGRILYVLWQEDGIPIRSLSMKCGLAITSLTTMLERMENQGLISRVQSETDKRKTLLFLTEKAHALKGEYDSASDEMGSIYYKGFSEEEITRFEECLDRIRKNLEEWQKS